jgi:hypothetical protein
MVKPLIPRYAIYYSPEPGSALDKFGRAWMGGPDGAVKAGSSRLDPAKIAKLTESSRRYGFHGTLKPPFELNPATSLDALIEAAKVFCRSVAPVEIPPLELAEIGKFIALTSQSQSAALEKLSAACVRAFEAFRMPLSEGQVQNYKQNKLTVHQEQMLENWGYPYVMEEFRFHMSLTDRIDDDAERQAVMESLRTLAAPILGRSVKIVDITVFAQIGLDQPMKPIERIPFGLRG